MNEQHNKTEAQTTHWTLLVAYLVSMAGVVWLNVRVNGLRAPGGSLEGWRATFVRIVEWEVMGVNVQLMASGLLVVIGTAIVHRLLETIVRRRETKEQS